MKLAFVVGSLSGGGAERIVSVISSEMAEKGHEVSVILVASTECSYDVSEKVKIIDCSKKYKKFGFINRVLAIRKCLKELDVDACISFTVAVNLYSILSCIGKRCRLIVAERNDPQYDPASKVLRIMRWALYPFANNFVFQTEQEKKFFSRKIQGRSIVIPNPVNPNIPEAFEGKRSCRIVTAARLEPQKNIKMAIDAFSIIHATRPEYIFEIYGQGSLREELERYSASKGIEGVVLFKGNSSNLYEDILDAQVFVLSSDYEGMSNSMIEAMALGIPTISTDYSSGGAREIIKNNENGIIVPVGDVSALANAIERVINNPDFANEISCNSIKVRDDLNIELITSKWMDYIERVI